MKNKKTISWILVLLILNGLSVLANNYYSLVNDNLRPADDEFYVNGILGSGTEIKASIARSKNKRSGDLYASYILYGVGERLTNNLIITEIDPVEKRVIIIDTTQQKFYALQMNYGQAVSRLLPMPDYKRTSK